MSPPKDTDPLPVHQSCNTKNHELALALLPRTWHECCGPFINMRASSLTFAVIAILTACSHSPVKPEGLELLLNGDVEEGLARPAHWDYWGTTSETSNLYKFRWEYGEYRSASHSLKISLNDISDPLEFAYWYQRIPIEPGTHAGRTLKLSSFIKLAEVTGYTVCLVIRANYPSGELVGFATTQGKIGIKGTKDWSSYSVELKDLSEEADEIMIYLLLGTETTGTVYFDDISLVVKD